MNNRKAFGLVIGIIMILIYSCSPIIYSNSWQEKDYNTISNSEWQEPFRFRGENSSLQYNITNDYKNIYISIKAIDENDQTKILLAGLEIWIDTTGQKKHQVGILYPFPQNVSVKNSKSRREINIYKEQFITKLGDIHLIGFKSNIDSVIPVKNNYGINISFDWDSLGTLYYKAIIPLNTFYKDSFVLSENKIFDFYFKVNPMPCFDKKEKREYKNDMLDKIDENSSSEAAPNSNANYNTNKNYSGRYSSPNDKAMQITSPYEEITFKIKMMFYIKPLN